jgi:putative flippase GtrA
MQFVRNRGNSGSHLFRASFGTTSWRDIDAGEGQSATAVRLASACPACHAEPMQALILRLVPWLPPPLRELASPARISTLLQVMKFGIVGTVGFLIDTATVYGLRASLGLYGAGAAAYVIAASGTWALNRVWTFRGRGSGPAHRQWALFMTTNLVGFALNRGTYALLVTFVARCADQPVYAVAAGAVAGMFINFRLSSTVVFR